MIHFYSINFQTRFPRESNTRYWVIFIYMEKKRYLSETIKFFHESRRGKFRNLPTSPFHSNISHIATRICVRLALPMPDRSTLWLRTWMLTITFVACQMRRRIGDTRNFPSREWNSRDSNCFRKGLRCKDVIIEDTSLRSNFRIKYRDDIIIYIRLEYSALNYLFVLIIRIYIYIYRHIYFVFLSKGSFFSLLYKFEFIHVARLKREFWMHTCVYFQKRGRKFVDAESWPRV